MIYRFIVLRGEMESLMNFINEGVIGVRSLVDNLSFLKAYNKGYQYNY